MSATVTHSGRYSLLTVELPGQEPASAGVLLEDPAADRLYVRLRRDWDRVAPDESEVLSALEDDVASKAAEMGAAKLLANLENRTVEAEGWEEAPFGWRLAPEMFVAAIVGRSMEPSIPNGALCVFRRGV